MDSLAYLRDYESFDSVAGETIKMADKAIIDIRKIIRDLVPYHLEQSGLIKALEDLSGDPRYGKEVMINFRHEGNKSIRFQKSVEIDIYRIVQELLNNAMKHAESSRIDIFAEINEKQFVLFFSDNGRGFNVQEYKAGLGLENLKTRINLYQGSLQLKSEPGKGTEYKIAFNLKNLK